MPTNDYDVLFLYNERETVVDTIANELQAIGYKVFMWRRDVEYGTEVDADETRVLKTVPVVLVFLGSFGWGVNHLRLFGEAQKLERKIVPVLIGEVSNKDLAEADGFFRRMRYVDVTKINHASIRNLSKAIDTSTSRLDTALQNRIINSLITGNDDQRLDAFELVRNSSDASKASIASRLRDQIVEPFNPSQDKRDAAYTKVSSERIPSVRSWMLSCLIATDPEYPDNKGVILKHLDVEYEKNNNVQYWVLAGLYFNNVSYLYDAAKNYLLSASPVFSEVRLLALAITNSDGAHVASSFIKDCQLLLKSSDPHDTWSVLRMLRIVPIPALAGHICALLNRTTDTDSLTYDAFFALANHGMPEAAAPLLTGSPGIRGTIQKLINVLANGWGYTMRIFARILLPLDAKTVDISLAEFRNNPQTRLIANKLRNSVAELREGGDSTTISYRRNISDGINVSHDLLNIKKDVKTLSAIVAAEGASLPLAIGLLGGWGTGKSFFMQSMQKEIRNLEEKGRSGQSYCSNIVQIDFNAWHYVDAHLLASLVAHIFEKLGTHVSPDKTDTQVEAEYRENILMHEEEIKKAQELEASTKQTIAGKEKELDLLKQRRESRKVSLSELTPEDFEEILGKDTTKQVRESLDEMGVPLVTNSLADFRQVVAEVQTTRGRTAALISTLVNNKNRVLLISLIIFSLCVIPLIFWLIRKYCDIDSITSNIWSVCSQVAVIISGATVMIKAGIKRVNSAIDMIDKARKKIEAKMAEKKSTPSDEETALSEEITSLKSTEQRANDKSKNAKEQIEKITIDLEALKKERSLTKFLADRRNSSDYKKHLGVISTIRKDFQDLIQKLEYARTHQDTTYRPVDRIILYIDDLDRCPAPKVMEVLQAVHLLLAYELFVVVVGVDPHWLLRSLESEHSVFQDNHNGKVPDLAWQGTPQSFLEKIFQIPFRLRTMTTSGYGKLMKELFTSSVDVAGSNGDLSSPAENTTQQPERPEADTKKDIEKNSVAGSSTGHNILTENALSDKTGKASLAKNTTPQVVVDEESLMITPWETEFSEGLFAFIPTPRSAKRFANVYCILKASVGLDQLSNFEGSAESPGEFQAPMLLLAILIGAPKEAKLLFPPLSKRGDILFALQHVATSQPPGSAFGVLTGKIQNIIDTTSFPVNTELFEYWTKQVSRFSFELILSD